MIRFDHVAVGCVDLRQGLDYVRARTGLEVPVGGRHPLMGTHNLVMATGLDTFLEIIAVDPDAAKPARLRWFGLDDADVHATLAKRARPHSWVLRSDDLDRDINIARRFGVDYGEALDLRRGDLRWRFAVRNDGAIPLDGAAPMLMQWPDADTHPAAGMPDLGARISRVTVATKHAETLTQMLDALSGDIGPVSIKAANIFSLSVEITLADGRGVRLD